MFGAFPVLIAKKITAKISCITKIPMAILPWRLAISPRSSSTFTANTVLEKLKAKPTNNALCQLSSLNKGSASAPSSNIKPLNRVLLKTICIEAGAQTCGFIKFDTLSLRPMLNNNKVTPKLANVFSSSVVLYPYRLSAKPANKKPIRGGSFSW